MAILTNNENTFFVFYYYSQGLEFLLFLIEINPNWVLPAFNP